MTKAELIDALAGRLGSTRVAKEAVNAFVEIIQAEVASGGNVQITNFGVFERQHSKAREVRNPATGLRMHVAASDHPRFRPGQGFKDAVKAHHHHS